MRQITALLAAILMAPFDSPVALVRQRYAESLPGLVAQWLLTGDHVSPEAEIWLERQVQGSFCAWLIADPISNLVLLGYEPVSLDLAGAVRVAAASGNEDEVGWVLRPPQRPKPDAMVVAARWRAARGK